METKEKIKKTTTAKPKVKDNKMTIAQAFYVVAKEGVKNKTELIEDILEVLKKFSIAKTKNGTPITNDVVAKQINAMLRDIKQQKGRWKGCKLENTDKIIKLIV